MSTHTSTKRGHARVVPADPESLVRFAELLKLRSLALTTQEEYLRYVRKLAARFRGPSAATSTWGLSSKSRSVLQLRSKPPR